MNEKLMQTNKEWQSWENAQVKDAKARKGEKRSQKWKTIQFSKW